MIRALKILLLLFTFLGVGLRVADLHAIAHEISHHIAEHDHDHDDETPIPCKDPHHHHHCSCAQPLFGLPEIPELNVDTVLITTVKQKSPGHWRMPEDPVYALDIPPIIG